MTLYLWQRAGLELCPPLVGQLGQYWRAERLLLAETIMKNIYDQDIQHMQMHIK